MRQHIENSSYFVNKNVYIFVDKNKCKCYSDHRLRRKESEEVFYDYHSGRTNHALL